MLRGVSAAFFVIAAASPASADPTSIGAWFGPRVFSDDSALGFIDGAPAHPVLQSTIAYGVRVSRPFFPWFVPELEFAVAPTKTDAVGGAMAARVIWLDPRLHVRFELMPGKRIMPFIVVGGGSPISISGASKTFDNGILGDGYLGGGMRFDSRKGFVLRFDARVSILPGHDKVVTPELDIGFGIEFSTGRRPRTSGEDDVAANKPSDLDGDGITDDKDMCGDRPEDKDGFEDQDGCPDIDNDNDRILDIADKCPSVPETYNGFEDDDGCPDTVPADVDSLRGTIEGLLYAEGETVVRDSAKPSIQKIAKLMIAHPSIRVVLIGHTDDREAKQFAEPVKGGPPPDLAALSADLSRARALAVKQSLIGAGIIAGRIDVEGHGFEEKVAENDKPKGRLANRRVEIKLYVPPSAPRL
jgi:outer membrane protein OmpA-like peptidoglycan-associated protein